ncbi:MAG: cell division/cell wall cluster transcriptional repressor MraZ [Deltaproteobacteria bacterium RBG_13_53_10]|nr:MAG: cell division/cell wall cluster transcriptional repressor MraZ [Deltaproteobacteria bacterium RBG_13_53_10]
MFRGRYEHTLDSKGRISIPSKFREILTEEYDNQLVITNFDHCLVAFPQQEWSNLEQKMGSLSLIKREARTFLRFFYSSGIDCAIDKQGRLLIPQALRDYASIRKEVVLVGEGKKIEIWSKERWEEEFRRSQENFEQISDTLAALGL